MTKWIDKLRQRRLQREESSAEQARAERKIEQDRIRQRKQEDLRRFHQKELEQERWQAKQKALSDEQDRMDQQRNQ